jgi:hypothetical protein
MPSGLLLFRQPKDFAYLQIKVNIVEHTGLVGMPYHGGRGQGLTDEFRATYPPEEEYCWESGCHGANPYESGFTLPKKIPAVIGATTLAKFADAAQLNAYIRATMPFWNPGSLTEEESWRVTAFLLRQNDLWNESTELNASNAADVKIPRAAFLTRSERRSKLMVRPGTEP